MTRYKLMAEAVQKLVADGIYSYCAANAGTADEKGKGLIKAVLSKSDELTPDDVAKVMLADPNNLPDLTNSLVYSAYELRSTLVGKSPEEADELVVSFAVDHVKGIQSNGYLELDYWIGKFWPVAIALFA
jgi:hypothetical protein